MSVADDLLPDLRADEGWRAHAYPDSLGFLTIGYGFLIDERKGGGLPKPVAEYWLRYAVNERLDELRRRWPAFERQPRDVQLALANMAYQLGPGGVLGFKRMIAALERGDRAAAAVEAVDSTWATQTPARARRIAALIRGTAA